MALQGHHSDLSGLDIQSNSQRSRGSKEATSKAQRLRDNIIPLPILSLAPSLSTTNENVKVLDQVDDARRFVEAMRLPNPVLSKYKTKTTSPDSPAKRALQKQQSSPPTVHLDPDSLCRICHKAFSGDDQLVLTPCCGNSVGSGCLEKHSKKVKNCFICCKPVEARATPQNRPGDIPNYIYRFGQRPEQQSPQVTSQPLTDSAPTPILLEKSDHLLADMRGTTESNLSTGPNDHTSTAVYQGPKIAKARKFVQHAFERFLEAANIFEELLSVDAKKTFVDQMVKELGANPPTANAQTTSMSAGDSQTNDVLLERFAEIKRLEQQHADIIQDALGVLYAPDAIDPKCCKCDRLRSRILAALLPDESIHNSHHEES
ncbi:MAG: hypothetical protein Q9217_001210 [Psora testacea]